MLNKLYQNISKVLVVTPWAIKASVAVVALVGIFVTYNAGHEDEIDLVNKSIELNPTGAGGGVMIEWQDNANDETGYVVERKQGSDGEFVVIATLDANETTYTDLDIIESSDYCYHVGAFNQAGTAYSDDACIEASAPVVEAGPKDSSDPVDSEETGSAIISVEFIDKPSTIELAGREFYSFKSDTEYNADFTEDSVSDVSYEINEGNLSYKDSSSLFVVTEQGDELDNGNISMRYNESNIAEFTLNGNGYDQTASLYISIGAWTSDEAGLLISVGDNSETVTLPKGRTWHYLKIDFVFDSLAAVKIQPVGNYGSYSAVNLAGVVLNQSGQGGDLVDDGVAEDTGGGDTSSVGVAFFNSLSLSDSPEIDVANVEYVTSEFVSGNEDLSLGEVISLDYQGTAKYDERTYTFVEDGAVIAQGYTGIKWDEENIILIDLDGSTERSVSSSLFLRAGAWSSDGGELELSLNGEIHPIELPKGRHWYYIRVDFEFTGPVHIELKPVGTIGSYSLVMFAGLTMQ